MEPRDPAQIEPPSSAAPQEPAHSKPPPEAAGPGGQAVPVERAALVTPQGANAAASVVAKEARREPLRWYRARPGFPPPPGCRRVYVPFRGWLDADDDVRRRVDGFFNVPMLILALLVLPLLVAEYYAGQESFPHPALGIALTAAAAFIWLAFLVEFVIKISIAPSRLQYALKNWIDIVIILLPMLRVLRGVRVLRVARSAKAARALKLYQLRGVGMKLVRATVGVVLGLGFVARIKSRYRKAVPAPAKPDYTHWPRSALIAEIERLSAELEQAKKRMPNNEP